jgi:DNA topoisomerase II
MVKKSVEQTYKKMSQIEHIKELPDSYIGSVEKAPFNMWVFDDKKKSFIRKDINIVPGLYKIFDEICVNSLDHHVRTKNLLASDRVTIIKVNIDQKENCISIYNNGAGIDIVKHKEHKIYIPEMIFGNLLTSANYDKNEKKITGGKNGYGAKLTNIFSTKFIIETIDKKRKLKYVQVFENNMSNKTEPKITKIISTTKPYTKITFYPDLKKFGMKKLDNDIVSLMNKRVYDMTACTEKTVSVYLNDKKIEFKQFDKYVDLYIGNKKETTRIYENVNEYWEIVACPSLDDKFDHVSFVNGIYTFQGGKHVEYVAKHLTRKLQTYASTKGYKRKKMKLKQSVIQDNLWLFIKSTIVNPSFSSQTKEYLTTNSTKFGSKFEISDKFIEKLAKSGVLERAMKLAEFKNDGLLSKIDGKKKSTLRGIPKLDDANWAGTKKSNDCTIILTEGDSAKAFAVAGLSVIGRDKYGVFPLKGKLLNTRQASPDKIANNAEISNLSKILGLKYDEDYENTSKLRYGHILVLTDQDVDGSHIKGLVFNWIHTFWPKLSKIDGFLRSMSTPIVKVKKKKKVIPFYTLTDYENWKKTIKNIKLWDTKYYKGLGTSTAKEAKEYFNNLSLIDYTWSVNTEKAMKLAFDKELADDRKMWLKSYDRQLIINQKDKNVPFEDFINKDLIHFSNYDTERSIPSMCDGLKPSQRKVLFGVLKRNLKKGIKVAQLSGYVSEKSCYHHGENSLNECIISMAQDFVGTNNINLLIPDGQFGTRLQGGSDSASPRYIFTYMSKLTQLIYRPEDYPLYNYLDDDGVKVEPEFYLPIIPMILVNGSRGIGTGFSTFIPNHNPLDIIDNIKNLIKNKPIKKMIPWYKKFTGDIMDIDDKIYNMGKIKKISADTYKITELPIGSWTDKYKDFLETLIIDKNADAKKKKNQCLLSFKSDSTDSKVSYTVKFKMDKLTKLLKNNELEKRLNLIDSKNTSTTNMHLYTNKGCIKKYESIDLILIEFYKLRLEYYVKRKEYQLKNLKSDLEILNSKVKFIQGFINKDIDIINKDDDEIENILEDKELPKISTNDDEPSYNYLIGMPIRSLTKKKIIELNNQRDKKEKEYISLQKKTPRQLWVNDLDEFLKEYKKNNLKVI